MLMNWMSLTALKLTKTFRRTVFVYTLNLCRLVIVLKLISVWVFLFSVGQSGLLLKTSLVTLVGSRIFNYIYLWWEDGGRRPFWLRK